MPEAKGVRKNSKKRRKKEYAGFNDEMSTVTRDCVTNTGSGYKKGTTHEQRLCATFFFAWCARQQNVTLLLHYQSFSFGIIRGES